MQKDKTIRYWDDFHSSNVSFEWNAALTPRLLEAITQVIDDVGVDNALSVLEIGCGVSALSRSLLEYLTRAERRRDGEYSYDFLATDVSDVCLEHNLARDAGFSASLQAATGSSLQYAKLDLLVDSAQASRHDGAYHFIIDKGAIDTFMFRSKTKKSEDSYPPILVRLLDNIHRWMRDGGRYVIVTSRRSIPAVQDFRGFSNVTKTKLGVESILCKGDKSKKTKDDIYLYECTKHRSYRPGVDDAHASKPTVDDKTECPKCGMTFRQLRGNIAALDQGTAIWTRRWHGHVQHCKG